MAQNAKIEIHHTTRLEGHGDIVAQIKDGRLENVRFDIVEAPRFFEALLQGRPYDETTHLASRICGICAVSHSCAALKASEGAFEIDVGEQNGLLRRLALCAEILGSHVLHVYYLAGPDFLEQPSILSVMEKDRETVLCAMRLKRLAHDVCEAVAGRHTHPVAMTTGGFTFVHSKTRLVQLKERLEESIEDLEVAVKLFRNFEIPSLERKSRYVSLKHPGRYALYDGDICIDGEKNVPADHYAEYFEERTVTGTNAKHAFLDGSPYMVGALARFNNNYEFLHQAASEFAEKLGLRAPCHNPFMIVAAQIVECVHCVEECICLIDEINARGIDPEKEKVAFNVRKGAAVGVVEAPRGLLIHEYEFDDRGICRHANCVIPTAQNLANLEADMINLTQRLADENKKDLERRLHRFLQILVRAYDPCISCSVHVVDRS